MSTADQMSKAERMFADRLRFLKAYYDLAAAAYESGLDNQPIPSMKFWTIGEQLGFDENRTGKLAHQLARDGLLKAVGTGGLYAITSKGIAYVDETCCPSGDTDI